MSSEKSVTLNVAHGLAELRSWDVVKITFACHLPSPFFLLPC